MISLNTIINLNKYNRYILSCKFNSNRCSYNSIRSYCSNNENVNKKVRNIFEEDDDEKSDHQSESNSSHSNSIKDNKINQTIDNNSNNNVKKVRNIFEEDEDENDNDRFNRERNNKDDQAIYMNSKFRTTSSGRITLRKPAKTIKKPIFTKEDIDYINEHDIPNKPVAYRNIMEEFDEEDTDNGNSTPILDLNQKSFEDLSGMKFEQLIKMIFKNKRTGELDIDEEDILELERMVSSNYNIPQKQQSPPLPSSNNNNNNSNSTNDDNNKK